VRALQHFFTQDHGAGGVLIADGLSPSGAATWKLSGLGSDRDWPYHHQPQRPPGRDPLLAAISPDHQPSCPPTPGGVGACLWASRRSHAASYGITASRAEDWSVCGQSRC
jgi:hypothetical protein